MTVADFRAPAPADCHTSVAVDLDHKRFWDLVTDALERIGEPGTNGNADDAGTHQGAAPTPGNAADVVRPESAHLTAGGVK
jgi:purine nucleosidase